MIIGGVGSVEALASRSGSSGLVYATRSAVLTLAVSDQPAIVVPTATVGSPSQDRLYWFLHHEGVGEDLLLEYDNHALTPVQFAAALPAKHYGSDNYRGQVRAITRSGNAVTVQVREFFAS